jgi:signal transduction histidine kinase
VQDEERRKVARDLHDSAGQTLTALKLSVVILQQKLDLNNDNQSRDAFSEILRLADEALQEIRTTSHLLHPPLLNEIGFTCAAQWYIEGFSRRSGIKVRMNFEPETERLPDSIETALFRVLQESLTNVHRHAGTSEVHIRFSREPQAAILEVRDYGCGIPKEILSRAGPTAHDSGVGLAGMRERLNDLQGRFEIESADPGTRLRAIVPLFARPPAVVSGPSEAAALTKAEHQRNYTACLNGFGYCDPSRLTPAEAGAIPPIHDDAPR